MENSKHTGGQIALLALSVLGAAIAIYLTIVHYASASLPLVCPTGGLVNCELVLSSSYSVVPTTNIPITLPGLFWYIVSAALAFAAWRTWPALRLLHVAQFVWALLGMLTVFYLVYVELVRLHTICAWCTAVHVIILIMFLITIVCLQRRTDEDELDSEEACHASSTIPATPK